MLVLSRKQSQSIVISGGIRITVVSIRGNQVRIGIEAPSSVAILREELHEPALATKANPYLATASTPGPLATPGLTKAPRRERAATGKIVDAH